MYADNFNDEAQQLKSEYVRDVGAGYGYSSDAQQVSRQRCYDVEASYSGQDGTITVSGLMSFDKLIDTLQTRKSSTSSFFFFSKSDESHYLKSVEDTESSVSLNFAYFIKGNVNVNLKGYGIEALNNYGKTIYQDMNNPYFGIMCGDQFINGFSEGAMLLMALNIHFANHAEKENFEQHKGKSSFLNIFSSTAEIQRIINQYNIQGQISLQAYQKGGDPGQLSKVLSKDPSGHYYILACDMTNIQKCAEAAHGMFDYAANNFANQVSFSQRKGLLPLGVGFAEYVPINFIAGLKEPPSLVTPEVLQARADLANEISKYNQYEEKIFELINNYPVVWCKDNAFYQNMLSLHEKSKKNLEFLHYAKKCFDMPDKCVAIKEQIRTKISEITSQEILPLLKEDYYKSPDLLHALLEQADFYYGIGNYLKAVEGYTWALKLNDKWIIDHRSLVLNSRGNAYVKSTGLNEHIVVYRHGNAYFISDNDYKAVEDYTEALKLNDRWICRSVVLVNRGNVYYKLGNDISAVEDYTEALKLNDRWIIDYRSLVLNNRGDAYAKLGDAIVLDNYGNVYPNLNNEHKAVDDYTEALKLNDKWINEHRSEVKEKIEFYKKFSSFKN